MSTETDDTERGELLREVPEDARTATRMGRFADAAQERAGRDLPAYQDLWDWSVDEPEAFWALVAEELGLRWRTPPERYLADPAMPGAVWCPGGTLNYAEQALAFSGDGPAIVSRSQCRDEVVLSRDELREQVRRCAAGLRRLGVGEGDAVAAYMPNIAETVVAFLATAALGATWASCAPEFGTRSVVDRLSQLRPDVLLVVDGYGYGTKSIDRTDEVAAIREELAGGEGGGPGGVGGGPGGVGGGPENVVLLPYLDVAGVAGRVPGAVLWDDLLAEDAPLDAVAVPFGHPLYVLFSSGTTGLPKPIVHGHGGVTLEHLKSLALHFDLGEEDRFLWFSTTGWMMWNLLVSGLLTGSTIVLLDGDPAKPDLGALWRLAEETELTVLGTSAPFLMACRKADVVPREEADLSRLKCVGSTGAPLPVDGFRWVYEAIATPGQDLLLSSTSGGTDVCTSFVGGSPLLPVRAGEISGRCLGVKVEAFDASAEPVIGEQGELVVTAPMPSMPIGFLGDEDGSRYRESYFDDFPGVWRHGDWITIHEDGACVISGRSDATLNRGGVRLGTAEFYAVVEDLDEVAESLVVHLEDDEGGAGELLLFVVPAGADGAPVDPDDVDRDALARTVAGELRSKLSPRHVPDALHLVPGVPKTLSGKKLEVPVKKVFTGTAVQDAASKGALVNPEVLDAYDALAAQRRAG